MYISYQLLCNQLLQVSSLNTHTFIISISVFGIQSWIIWILYFKILHWAGSIIISEISCEDSASQSTHVTIVRICFFEEYWVKASVAHKLLIGGLPWSLTIWTSPHSLSSKASSQERKRGYLQKNHTEVTIIWNLIELTSHHISCTLFVRSDSQNPVLSYEEGVTQRRECQEMGITEEQSRICLPQYSKS